MDEFGPDFKTITVPVKTVGNQYAVHPYELKQRGIWEILDEVRRGLLGWAEREEVNLIADTEDVQIQVRVSARGVECPEEIEWEEFKKMQLRSDLPAFRFAVQQEEI